MAAVIIDSATATIKASPPRHRADTAISTISIRTTTVISTTTVARKTARVPIVPVENVATMVVTATSKRVTNVG